MTLRLLVPTILLFFARAATATTADDICPPAANPCVVGTPRAVTPNSTLDFQQRSLVLQMRGSLTASSGNLTIFAGGVTLQPGARIVAPGTVAITVTDDITVGALGTTVARIDVSGSTVGHAIRLMAGDDITINGLLDAKGTADNPAGIIDTLAGGDLSFTGEVDVSGTSQGGSGVLTLRALGATTISGTVNGDGGGLDGADLTFRAGTGTLNVLAGAKIDVNGGGSFGSGGFVDFLSDTGNVIFAGQLQGSGASGGEDCGDGASLAFEAATGVEFAATGQLTVNAGSNCLGGDVDFFTETLDVTLNGTITATGGGVDGEGGQVTAQALRNVTFAGPIDLSGGSGGLVDGTAGATLVVSAILNADGDSSFGTGGTLLFQACTVTLSGTGRLSARGDIGFIELQASGRLTVNGVIVSEENLVQFRDPALPPILNGSITPTPRVELTPALPACGQIVLPPTTTTTSTSTTSTTRPTTTTTTSSTSTSTSTTPSSSTTTTTFVIPTSTTTSSTTTTSVVVPSSTTTTTTIGTSTTTSTTGPTATTSTSVTSTSTTTGSTTSTTGSSTSSTSAAPTTSTTTTTSSTSTSSSATTTSTTGTTTSTTSSSSTTSSTTGSSTTVTTSTSTESTSTVTSTSTTTTTTRPFERCNDGIDNDGNGLADCADPACFGDPVCLGRCAAVATFESINCRLDMLLEQIAGEPALGALQGALSARLGQAQARKDRAEDLCATGNTRRAKSALHRAVRRVIAAERTLRVRDDGIPPAVIAPFLSTVDELRLDLRSLASGVGCP